MKIQKKTIKHKNYQKHQKNRKSKKHTNNAKELVLFTTNAAGLKLKSDSLKSELNYLNVGIFTVQETHYKKKGSLKIEDWVIFEAIRRLNKRSRSRFR